jgi:hypothetical protein
MTRKDSEKESERPHYYSQFWLDVAAGRRVIGAPKPNEDGELVDTEIPEPMPQRRARPIEADMRSDSIIHPVAEPIAAPDEFIEPDDAILKVDDDQDEVEYQEAPLEDADIPDMDLTPADEEEEEEFFEEEEEEEDDDMNWGRGRKKNKPARPVKPPVKKPGKREPRRGY